MTDNICWANPDVEECWAFRGRLYKSYKKADIERNKLIKTKEKWAGMSEYWARFELDQIYHVTLVWNHAER